MSAAPNTDTPEPESRAGTLLPSWIGWIGVLLVLAYTTFIHQGLGAPPNGMATDWWHASGFLRRSWLVGLGIALGHTRIMR